MLFIIKLFPEITIKSRPVRRRLVRLLRRNLKRLLKELDPQVSVIGEWDVIEIETGTDEPAVIEQITERLRNTPGIARIQRVSRYPLGSFDEIAALCLEQHGQALRGKTFAVRCKRHGRHSFNSMDVEKHVGAVLMKESAAAGVRLKDPEVTVSLEIRQDDLHLVEQQYPGLGGFPLGSQEGVLSLISGGFDSAVSSYLCIRRGLLTHYCFFNLGGSAHELAVKEVALYLWMKYNASHQVRFVTVPFEKVVEEILLNVENSQMGVILKRMMLRAATRVADRLRLNALVTGESIAQVSSQTLPNLAVIDSVTDKLVLRPLITTDKQEIIDIARAIGSEEFSRHIPEYCGVISVNPTTRARPERIEREESRFDLGVIDRAVESAQVQLLSAVSEDFLATPAEVQVTDKLAPGVTLIDIRHPDELERSPLSLNTGAGVDRLEVPFYQLQTFLAEKDRDATYLLYCDKGMMSRLHAAHLIDMGFHHVGVYAPDR